MVLSLQECIDAIKKEYPSAYPYSYIEYEGKYVFNLVNKNVSPSEAISDMHIVDPQSGYVSGGISIMEFLKDSKFREAWKKPNLVANHDQNLQHSNRAVDSPNRTWRVRKKHLGKENNEFSFIRKPESDFDDKLTYGGVLSHYGIPGQKWGKRNGPPYPLDPKVHDKVTEKTNSNSPGQKDDRTGLSAEAVTLITVFSFLGLKMLADKVTETPRKNAYQKKFNESNAAISKDLIGDIADVGKTFTEDSPPRMIEGKHSIDDDMAAINPRYKNGIIPGTRTNCTLCSFAYDLRRRGYDVTALSSETGNYPDRLATELYEDPVIDKMSARSFSELFEKAEKKYPEGSRGSFSAYGPFMAHSMAWEIQNGKMVILDTQRNVKMTARELKEYGFDSNKSYTNFIRTDNLKLKYSGIHLVSAELKPGWKKIIQKEQKEAQKIMKQNNDDSKTAKGLTEAQRIHNYEELWKKYHPGYTDNAASRDAMNNWVKAQINK